LILSAGHALDKIFCVAQEILLGTKKEVCAGEQLMVTYACQHKKEMRMAHYDLVDNQ
jgi:hypothetical protein